MIRKTLKENKNKNKNYFYSFIIFFLIIIVGFPISATASYFLAFRLRVYPKVSVCKIPLTGKEARGVKKSIASAINESFPLQITLLSGKEEFPISPDVVKYQKETTLEKIFQTGREKPFILNLKNLFSLFKEGKDLTFELKLDNTKLYSEIASISAKLYIPAIDPEIKVVKDAAGKKVLVETDKNGQEIDLRSLKMNLLESLACPKKEISLKIPLGSIAPKISESMAEEAKKRATALLNKEIKLSLEDQSWTLSDEEIINFISFEGNFDKNKVKNFTAQMAKTVNSESENALFRFENDKVVVFKPSKEGIELKEEELIKNLVSGLIALEQTSKNQEIEIPTLKIPAKISTGDANSLGIKELLGKGASLFYGSISERLHNINLASLRLSGILVPPGETFSFNSSLGDVSADTGFKQAYIIKEGRTILGDGGGVCQVSTTLFRAALNAGLPITERYAHAYRVHYYEDDLGPGFDATVFDPNADLKFSNNTPGYLIIQSGIDIKKRKLTFDIYGTDDGRKVEISKARVWDQIPPPPDLYQDDPTLAIGTIKQVDWKAWGAKVSFNYKVIRGDEILEEKTFSSTYKPWQAVYLRGIKG